MSKKEEVKKEEVNQPEGAPVVIDATAAVSRETMAHQWQKDSAAINTNELAGYADSGKSVLDAVADAQPKKSDEHKAEKISEAEYERRCKLDVSDKDYINKSLDHVVIK